MPKGKLNKRYTTEFKIKVIGTMQKENLSCQEAARKFDVSSDTVPSKWERNYLEEGKDRFYVGLRKLKLKSGIYAA